MSIKTIDELNTYLSDNLMKLDITQYIQKYHDLLKKDMDISFMNYFLYLCEHPNEIIVNHKKLIEFGIFDSTRSNDIKKRIDSTELEEGVDYELRNVAQQLPSGTKHTNHYTLTPKAFKLCLMRSKKQIKYAKYYLFLEECIHYYQKYQDLYMTVLLSGKDEKIDRLERKIDEQNKKLDEMRGDTKDIKLQNEDLKQEVKKVNEKLDRMEYYIKNAFDIIDKNNIDIFKTNCIILYKITNMDNSIQYLISSRQLMDITKVYKEKKKDSNIKSIKHLKVFNPSNNASLIKSIKLSLKNNPYVFIRNNTINTSPENETMLMNTIDDIIKNSKFNAFEKLNIQIDKEYMDAYSHIYTHIANRIFELFISQDKIINKKMICDIYKTYQQTFPKN